MKVYEPLWMRIDSRSNIASACGRMRIFDQNALRCIALSWQVGTMDGHQRCADSRILVPHPVRIRCLASVSMSPSLRILNLHLPKNFQTRVPSMHLSMSAFLSDGYVTIH